jgi:hypothetical protein
MTASGELEKTQSEQLATFDALRVAVDRWIDEVVTKQPRPVPIPNLIALIEANQKWREGFASLQPVAQRLATASLPELANRLSAQLTDIDNAVSTYKNMIETAKAAADNIFSIQQKTDAYTTKIITDVATTRAEVFAKMAKLHNERD